MYLYGFICCSSQFLLVCLCQCHFLVIRTLVKLFFLYIWRYSKFGNSPPNVISAISGERDFGRRGAWGPYATQPSANDKGIGVPAMLPAISGHSIGGRGGGGYFQLYMHTYMQPCSHEPPHAPTQSHNHHHWCLTTASGLRVGIFCHFAQDHVSFLHSLKPCHRGAKDFHHGRKYIECWKCLELSWDHFLDRSASKSERVFFFPLSFSLPLFFLFLHFQ